MELGVTFPQTEIGTDPAVIKDFVQTAEALGYTHLLVYDHVLGAHPDRAGWPSNAAYTHESPFHEVFTLMAYLAAVTERMELATSVLILPQRQTVLVAKQAAAVDLLSGGRLRLGVGTGWNWVEYVGLGEDFRTRGKRQVEQIDLLRRLWTEDLLDYQGTWHRIDRASILPRPQRRIPIWFGGSADAVLRRAARLGDGWTPAGSPRWAQGLWERLQQYLRAEGRDPAAFGLQGAVPYGTPDPVRWRRQVQAWRDMGATHVALTTMSAGLPSPRHHMEALRRFREALAEAPPPSPHPGPGPGVPGQ